MKQWHLFLAFFRPGILGYGGGPSSIPLVHKEVVGKYKWMSDEEFGDVLALANMLPGPIATKLAGYIGYRIGGPIGLINAVLASVLPTILLMILFMTTLTSSKEQPWVLGMTKAVVPVVGVMLAVLTWQFYQNGRKAMGWKGNLLLVAVSLIVMKFLNIHPGILIAALLILAVAGPEKKKQKVQIKEAAGSKGKAV
ncbi:chromate transporter [Neobacillus terrae]|uniref:chromate transporter n=1 Tax=Neobacillus terrae TaxID=3034837 RepID=UPI00140B99A5|nr:chromate transporter [Neobacillus terrae]NHM32626.1 chromate transporter [Neobacillus terrae]